MHQGGKYLAKKSSSFLPLENAKPNISNAVRKWILQSTALQLDTPSFAAGHMMP